MNLADIGPRFISAVIKDDTDERRQECRLIPADVFTDDRCRNAWEHVVSAANYIEASTGPARVFFAHNTLGEAYTQDRWALIVSLLHTRGPEYLPELGKLVHTGKSRLLARLESRRFDLAAPPPEPVPRFYLNGKGISTPGNIMVPQAQAGTGKTSWIAALISAKICAEMGTSNDTLGITADPDSKGVLIWIDTEQSIHDEHQQVVRSLRRAGVDSAPEWLRAYPLADFSAIDMRSAVALLMEQSAAEGIFAVVIDGVADLVNDVNDAAECNALVAELHAAAIKYNCPIVAVLHENPGSDNGKGRGHLGSQLTRKAETVLRLVKKDEITTVFSHKARRAPILERDGPRFAWSDEDGMHVSVQTTTTLRGDENLADLRDLAEEVFSGSTLRYAEACQRIEKARRVGEKAGEKWFTRMKKANVIRNRGMGVWEVAA